MNSITEIEKRIRDAVTKLRAKGWTIKDGRPCIESKECCVVVALAIASGVMTTSLCDTAELFQLPEGAAGLIARGFDGLLPAAFHDERGRNFIALGAKLRAEYLGGGK